MLAFIFPLIFSTLIPVAAWWAAFRLPLGRKTFRVETVIEAPIGVVWRKIDPRELDYGWRPHWEIENAEIIDDDPLTVEARSRPGQSEQEFERDVYTYAVNPEAYRVTEWRIWRGEAAVPEKEMGKSQYALQAHGDSTWVTLDYTAPANGLLISTLVRHGLERHLAALKDAALARPPSKAPLIKFTGWKWASLSLICAVGMMAAPALFNMLYTPGAAATMMTNPVWAVFPFVVVAGAAMVELSTVIHELGHAGAMLVFGHRNITISLIPLAGGVALSSRRYATNFEAGVIAIAGVFISALARLSLLPLLGGLSDFFFLILNMPRFASAAGVSGE